MRCACWAAFDEAIRHAQEALELCEALGNAYFGAFARATLGCIAIALGEIPRAREHFEEAPGAFDDNGASGDAALVVNNLGLCALYEGKPETAAVLCRQALERSRLARYDFCIAHALHSSALVIVRTGAPFEASGFLERALAVAVQLTDRELCLMCLEAASEIAYETDEYERAATLSAAAEHGRRRFHALRAPIKARSIDELNERIHHRLGMQECDSMRAVGAVLSLDDALDQTRVLLDGLRHAPSLGRA
jgi:tetratricopeptide (TPR) repeat protein